MQSKVGYLSHFKTKAYDYKYMYYRYSIVVNVYLE